MSDAVSTTAASPVWPELNLPSWPATRDTLHLWTQIVGKVRLALEPMVNHWWQVPLYVSARGLTTSLMHCGDLGLEIEFDFINHVLEIRTTADDHRTLTLERRSVASFYRETMAALGELGIAATVFDRPVELPEAIPFGVDEGHRSYDPEAAHRFWLALVQSHRVMSDFRARFLGKASPVHFFWGAADLATSRFSGRRAPKHPGGVPNCPDRVQELAYSHEVSSCGFWPGGAGEGLFYAYGYPEPAGFADWTVEPHHARYDTALSEFVLPYTAVRTAEDPAADLLAFFESAYAGVAQLAQWDRAALELPPD